MKKCKVRPFSKIFYREENQTSKKKLMGCKMKSVEIHFFGFIYGEL